MNNNESKIISVKFCSFLKNYEFYGSYLLNHEHKKAHNFTNYMLDNYKDLYFEVLDEGNILEELVTGKRFIKMDDSNEYVLKYYNEGTGLRLLRSNDKFEDKIDFKIMVNKVFNSKYIVGVEKFFKNYENLQNKDELYTNKLLSLKLKKGIPFTEE